jgi:hypothetical protein
MKTTRPTSRRADSGLSENCTVTTLAGRKLLGELCGAVTPETLRINVPQRLAERQNAMLNRGFGAFGCSSVTSVGLDDSVSVEGRGNRMDGQSLG